MRGPWPKPEKAFAELDADAAPKRLSGSPPKRSYAARLSGSESTVNALETTAGEQAIPTLESLVCARSAVLVGMQLQRELGQQKTRTFLYDFFTSVSWADFSISSTA